MKSDGADKEPEDEYELVELDSKLVRSTQSSDPAAIPVPAVPVRTCTACGYNLTGLLSRRCPECGTGFSIAAGRNVTIVPTSEIDDVRAVAWDRVKFCVGLIALTAGIVGPWVGPGFTLLVVRGVLVSVVNLFFLKHMMDYVIASGQGWSAFLFRAGLMTAALSGMVMLFF